ncbi:MAG TPA: DinB family protein [Gemmatimonadaceae bacterium]
MFRRFSLIAAFAAVPAIASAQANPVATAFKATAARQARNLVAAAEEMPAGKYGYKPTPAQMSFGDIVDHLAEGNDYLCGVIGGSKAPTRAKVSVKDGKDKQVARLKETFEFCNTALANLTDARLDEQLDIFGTKMTRAGAEFLTVGDWADHYSQFANYLRINGMLPPTAKPAPKPAVKPTAKKK